MRSVAHYEPVGVSFRTLCFVHITPSTLHFALLVLCRASNPSNGLQHGLSGRDHESQQSPQRHPLESQSTFLHPPRFNLRTRYLSNARPLQYTIFANPPHLRRIPLRCRRHSRSSHNSAIHLREKHLRKPRKRMRFRHYRDQAHCLAPGPHLRPSRQ
jgi:hypothetical protein